jgi:ABC-type antimicrobial peptide transport system permease subunit
MTEVRVALGASPRDMLCLILRETCSLAFFGSLLGCAGAFAAGRLAMNQVYLAPSVAASQDQTMSLHPAAFIISSLEPPYSRATYPRAAPCASIPCSRCVTNKSWFWSLIALRMSANSSVSALL